MTLVRGSVQCLRLSSVPKDIDSGPLAFYLLAQTSSPHSPSTLRAKPAGRLQGEECVSINRADRLSQRLMTGMSRFLKGTAVTYFHPPVFIHWQWSHFLRYSINLTCASLFKTVQILVAQLYRHSLWLMKTFIFNIELDDYLKSHRKPLVDVTFPCRLFWGFESCYYFPIKNILPWS